MSHNNANGGVPKTLIQHLIRWVISSGEFEPAVGEVLGSVLDTEITPELVPTDGDWEQLVREPQDRAAALAETGKVDKAK